MSPLRPVPCAAVLALSLAAASCVALAADEWPLWGGSPSRNMVSRSARGLPPSWDPATKRNVRWTAPLGSQSYGNPVVAGGRVYAGTNNARPRDPNVQGDKGVLLCLAAADGQLLWQAVHDKLEAGNINDYSEVGICSSPAVVGDRIFYVSNRAELVCADAEGFHDGENDGPFTGEKLAGPGDADIVWSLDMIAALGVFPHYMATSSPLVLDGRVFLVTSNGIGKDLKTLPSPRAPSFIAVEQATGKVVWQSAAPGSGVLEGQWSSPAAVTGPRPQVIFAGGDGWLRSFEPATGKPIWELDANPAIPETKTGRGARNYFVATPVVHEGRIHVALGQNPEHGDGPGGLLAIDASKAEGGAAKAVVWRRDGDAFRRTISTCAVHDGLVYSAELRGYLKCFDAATGEPYWEHDLLATVWGSPYVADGKVYIGDEDGDVVVVRAGKKLEVLFESNLGDSIYATPVAVGDVLYIATRTTLYALAGNAP